MSRTMNEPGAMALPPLAPHPLGTAGASGARKIGRRARVDSGKANPKQCPMPRKMMSVMCAGASFLALTTPQFGAPSGPTFTEQDRAWWAIQPLRDPDAPGGGEAANPIDAFVDRQRGQAGLTPAPPAGPDEFLRRASFDLHGLPPAPEQVDAFRAAWERDQDAAVEALINELLASPRYGERWAQHWLDVVRYAESDGYREDAFRPEAHHYRDYVIRAFNEDKPFDRFVREQLAADEFAPGDPATLVATGFLRLGIYEWNQRNAEMQHELMINEITNLTGEVFLGVGIGCAQCHDHKFDPLLQRDYYALQAFLASTSWPTDRRLGTPEELAADAAWEESAAPIRAEMNELLAAVRRKTAEAKLISFPENVQEMYRKPESERSTYEQQIFHLVQRQIDRDLANINVEKSLAGDQEKLTRHSELAAQLATLGAQRPALPAAFISVDTGPRPARTWMNAGAQKTEIQPAFPALLGEPAPLITPKEHSTGRRSALADWIVKPDNPLTARVYVNRIWQHHFGAGLVATANDFGMLGEPPSHPELLDWLTSRFLDGGWQTKPLHHLIMTSAAYRQTSRREPGEAERRHDPGNRLLWRYPPRRLSAEEVRDAMLAVSGELQQRAAGGPSAEGGSPERSLYVRKLRNTPDHVLKCFDAPAGFDSAPERQQTTTPTQALLLSNNEWPMARARAFAERLLGSRREAGADEIARGYRLAWGREPSDTELRLALDFIAAQEKDRHTVHPAPPAVKFPDENGLRPVTQNFGKVEGIALGSRALWLQPTSRFEQLHLSGVRFESDVFTVEAVAQLDGIQKDSSVNTLISRWNGDPASAGWAFGVTSAKSRYEPRNLIVQLTGANPGGDVEYEVVASGLRVPLGRPVFLAAAIEARPNGQGTVRFYLKDLGDPEAELQTAEVSHNIAGMIQNPATRLLIGGRDEKGNAHLWDGQLGRLDLSTRALAADELITSSGAGKGGDALHATFDGENPEEPLAGARWLEKPTPVLAPTNPALDALADFCHALLSSNEFLYLH